VRFCELKGFLISRGQDFCLMHHYVIIRLLFCIQIPSRPITCTGGCLQIAEQEISIVVASLLFILMQLRRMSLLHHRWPLWHCRCTVHSRVGWVPELPDAAKFGKYCQKSLLLWKFCHFFWQNFLMPKLCYCWNSSCDLLLLIKF